MKGFTLAELLVTIALTAIVLTIAIPGYRDLVINNQRSSISTDLYADLQLARSQSIARNQRVSVCKSADGLQCLASGLGSWAQGWLVFVNPGGGGSPADPADVLSVHGELPSAFSLIPEGTPSLALLSFKPDGRGVAAVALKLCYQFTAVAGRRVRMLASGAVLVVEGSCS